MKRALLATLACLAALGAASCGGTSGRENLPVAQSGSGSGAIDATEQPDGPSDDAGDAGTMDATVDMDADATVTGIYTDLFDVVIVYADRALPEAQAPQEGGVDGSMGTGGGMPNCPPWLPNPDLRSSQVPGDYGPDGGVIPALDGSPCATYPWLGSTAADDCVTANFNVISSATSPGNPHVALLPPCNWAVEAGVATGGVGAALNKSRYDLCLDLYRCMIGTLCFTAVLGAPPRMAEGKFGITDCFCGRDDAGAEIPIASCVNNPQGPCKEQEMAAFELLDSPANYASVLSNLFHVGTGVPEWPSCLLNTEVEGLINSASTSGCPEAVTFPSPSSGSH
jgi:hypothetical protein